MNEIEITLAANIMRDNIQKDAPLKDRVAEALRYAMKNQDSVFWMSYQVTDVLILQSALAGVLMAGNEKDSDIIARSLKPLQALSAAISGVPVDFSAVETSDDVLPLVGMLREAKAGLGK